MTVFRDMDTDFAVWAKCEAFLAFSQALATPPCPYLRVHRNIQGVDMFLAFEDAADVGTDDAGIWLHIEAFASGAEARRVHGSLRDVANALMPRTKAWKGIVVLGVPEVWMTIGKSADFEHDFLPLGASHGTAPIASMKFWNLD